MHACHAANLDLTHVFRFCPSLPQCGRTRIWVCMCACVFNFSTKVCQKCPLDAPRSQISNWALIARHHSNIMGTASSGCPQSRVPEVVPRSWPFLSRRAVMPPRSQQADSRKGAQDPISENCPFHWFAIFHHQKPERIFRGNTVRMPNACNIDLRTHPLHNFYSLSLHSCTLEHINSKKLSSLIFEEGVNACSEH